MNRGALKEREVKKAKKVKKKYLQKGGDVVN